MTARGARTTVDVVVAEISDVESRGRGEGVLLRRYGESIDSVVAAIDAMKGAVFSGLNRDTLQHALPPGAALRRLHDRSGRAEAVGRTGLMVGHRSVWRLGSLDNL